MTAVDLDAIRRREQAATEGPWTDQGSWNTQTYRSVLAGLVTSTGNHAADADFIRHSRTDVPALADEIEQLRAKVDEQANRIAELENMLAYANGDAGRSAFNAAMDYLR